MLDELSSAKWFSMIDLLVDTITLEFAPEMNEK